MQHRQEKIEVNDWGLTPGQMETVVRVQNDLGGSALMFDYAYDVVTGDAPLGAGSEGDSFVLKPVGSRRRAQHTEETLAQHYSAPYELMRQGDYVRARWSQEQ